MSISLSPRLTGTVQLEVYVETTSGRETGKGRALSAEYANVLRRVDCLVEIHSPIFPYYTKPDMQTYHDSMNSSTTD
jgi:hypothetical protein